MTQGRIDWSRDVSLPVQGRTPQAEHAGATGAQMAAKYRGLLSVAYLNLLTIGGSRGFSDFEAAAALGRQVSSINSTRAGLKTLVTPSGSFEETPWGSKRCRYTVAQEAQS